MSWTQRIKRKDNEYIIGMPTADKYDKSNYKWDPKLKKTVYIGKSSNKSENDKPKADTNIKDKIKIFDKQTITDNFVKLIKKDNMENAAKFMGSILKSYEHEYGEDKAYGILNKLKDSNEFKAVMEWATTNHNPSDKDRETQIKNLQKAIVNAPNLVEEDKNLKEIDKEIAERENEVINENKTIEKFNKMSDQELTDNINRVIKETGYTDKENQVHIDEIKNNPKGISEYLDDLFEDHKTDEIRAIKESLKGRESKKETQTNQPIPKKR